MSEGNFQKKPARYLIKLKTVKHVVEMYSKIDGNGETILMILPRMRNPIGNIALCFFFFI